MSWLISSHLQSIKVSFPYYPVDLTKPGYDAHVYIYRQCERQIVNSDSYDCTQANIAWSYATLSHKPEEELLEAIAVEADKKLAEFSPQNISNLLYAFAKLEHKPSTFLEQASRAAVPILGSFTPQVTSSHVALLACHASHICICSLLKMLACCTYDDYY